MSRHVGGVREKEDMRRWVRGEFDKWRHITDEVCSCNLLSQTTMLVDGTYKPIFSKLKQ